MIFSDVLLYVSTVLFHSFHYYGPRFVAISVMPYDNSVLVSIVSHVTSYVTHMYMRVRIAIVLALLPLFHVQSETTMAEGTGPE